MGETEKDRADEGGSSRQKKKNPSSQPKRNEGDREKEDKEAAEHQRKAELETKIRERVACEAKAFDVVNRLIEPDITPEYLLEACKFIDHSHYEDIVEERTIGRLCGYPVCSNKLTQIAKKKYHISTRTNTVYDITERKKFCSNECYRASQFLQKQIPQTPVWTRRDEPAIKFELLQPKAKISLEGEEVIGSSMFSLKEEVTLLEKMDQKTQETASSTTKHRPASRDSLEESKRLSDKLLSLSTEEDLGSKLESLSLGDEGKGLEHRTSGATSDTCLPGAEAKGQKKTTPDSSVVPEGMSVGLETEVENLTLIDKTPYGAADSDEEEDEERESGGNGMVQSTDSATTPLVQDTARTDHSEASKKLVAADLKQQPGESKAEYLMRLLDKRQKLFSKVADIQENTAAKPQPADRLNPSAQENTAAKPQPAAGLNPSADDKEREEKTDSDKVLETDSVRRAQGEQNQTAEVLSGDSEGRYNQAAEVTGSSSPTKQVIHKSMSPRKAKSMHSTPTAKASPGSSPPQVSPLSSVCQIVSEWFTLETLAYLGLATSQGQSHIEGHSSHSFHKDPEIQKKYQDLCQRLADQEKDFDDILGEDNVEEKESMRGRRPVPNFEELKKQTEEYQDKLQQFFSGPSAARKKKTKGDGGDHEDSPESDRPVVLPVIDSHNQLLIRRRIVLERLDRMMPSLLPPLGLSVQDVSASLRELVFTFSLTSHNIVFKPAEWTLVAIVLLRVLATKSQAVTSAFKSQSRCITLNMVLGHLGHSCASLGQLVDNTLSHCKEHLLQPSDQ